MNCSRKMANLTSRYRQLLRGMLIHTPASTDGSSVASSRSGFSATVKIRLIHGLRAFLEMVHAIARATPAKGMNRVGNVASFQAASTRIITAKIAMSISAARSRSVASQHAEHS